MLIPKIPGETADPVVGQVIEDILFWTSDSVADQTRRSRCYHIYSMQGNAALRMVECALMPILLCTNTSDTVFEEC